MQDTTAASPAQSADVLGPLTTVHFGIIAVLAVLTIIGIVYGMTLARRRREGTRDLEASGHLDRIGDAPVADPDAPGEAVAAMPAARTEPDRADAQVVQVPEPVPVPPVEPVAVPVVTPAPVAADATDLTMLKGLGPKVATMLVDLGVPDIATLARLDAAQADAIAGQLGTFAPRMARDRWVEQARLLAAGDRAGFEAMFGRL